MMEAEVLNKKKPLTPKLRFKRFIEDWKSNTLLGFDLKVIDGDRGTNYPNGDDFSSEGYCLFMSAKNVTKTGFSFEEKVFITKEKDELLRKGKLKRNDLVLTTRGSVGNIAFYNSSVELENLRINSGMVIIRNENKELDPNFIYFSFFSPKLDRQLKTIAFGSAQPQLTVKEINKFKFSIPTFFEQQKIASFLTAVDKKIQQLTRKKELLEQYKKGVMQQLFSGKLRFKDENGKAFPNWEEKFLGDIFHCAKGNGLSKDKLEFDGKYECILYGQLYTTYKEVVRSVASKTNCNEGTLSRVGDLLVPCSTTTTGIDLGNVTALNIENVLLGGDITILRTNAKVDNIFYAYYLSNYKKHKIASYAQGSTIVHLSYNHLKLMKIDLPCFEEQNFIANLLINIDNKIESITKQINQTQTFKKGLLQQMFV